MKLSFLSGFCLIFVIFTSFSDQKQTQGVIMVGGALRPTTYTVTSTHDTLFKRKNYHLKTGRISGVLGANTLRINTGLRHEEFSLIGLIDFSPEINAKLRKDLMDLLKQSYAQHQAMIYVPKNFKDLGLRHNHAFVVTGNKLINSEILKKGWGVLPPSQEFSPTLKLAFSKVMNQAIKENKGIWAR